MTWAELQVKFRAIALRRDGSMEELAQEIPADRSTVYRLMRGEIQRPCLSLREGVKRIVEGNDPDRAEGVT